MNYWILQTMNALAFGSLLFLLSSGFSLIFGLMKIPNMAHGALFMCGAFIVVALVTAGCPFVLAVPASGLAVGVLGWLLERTVLRRIGGNELAQVLATLGIAFIVADGCRLLWGTTPLQIDAPAALQGSALLGGVPFPRYRLLICALALASAATLLAVERNTRIGARIRAAVDDADMARAMGVRVDLLFALVFAAACALVGMAGALGVPMLSAYLGLDMEMLPFALIVVILGGVGSLGGALLASTLTGLCYVFGQALLPGLAYVILFLPMVAMLALRPQGLFGKGAP